MKVKIKKLHPEAVIPKYATVGSSGFDLVSVENKLIEPGKTVLIGIGLSVEIPQGFELQVRPRSGLSLKTGLRVANAPGTVDADFRGQVCVIITNTANPCGDHFGNGCGCQPGGEELIKIGDRIAQGVIQRVEKVEFELVEELNETERGEGGFGSTGVSYVQKDNV